MPPHARSIEFTKRCMEEAGWEVELDDGGISGDPPPGQEVAYNATQMECVTLLSETFPRKPLTAASLASLYKLEMKNVACLERLGYSQTVEPPSEQQFIDDNLRGQNTWAAYGAVGAISPGEFAELSKKCPQPDL